MTMFFLAGQLVGSSGGILFLAEFVVTTVGLVLGGAATISTNAFESWICFFCLSSTAFWGYLLARVSLANSVRLDRHCGSVSGGVNALCPARLLLMASVGIFGLLWFTSTMLCEWELLTTVMLVRPGWRSAFVEVGGEEEMEELGDVLIGHGGALESSERSKYYRNLLP